jgi:predicted enzyme related to lactoylglutathione lyase
MLEDAKVMAIVPVHDLGRARTFYEKMLGLSPSEVHEAEGQVI